ncbi:hypothetical protein HUU42_07355 [bacterium]|nr:hypothetical protein [bacterium]
MATLKNPYRPVDPDIEERFEGREWVITSLDSYFLNVTEPLCVSVVAERGIGGKAAVRKYLQCRKAELSLRIIECDLKEWSKGENAADFFFPKRTNWTSLTEIRLNDKQGKSAGNIDLVLVSYDSNGKITDFGSLEIQGVYISGNVRKPFEKFMGNHDKSKNFDWSDQPNYPHADYLSSSRKRLVPQLIYKGGILHNWKKRMAVALHEGFYKTLPELPRVEKEKADVAWFVYTLNYQENQKRYKLELKESVYTKFHDALDKISVPEPGNMNEFLQLLQNKLDEKLDNPIPPDAPSLSDVLTQEND